MNKKGEMAMGTQLIILLIIILALLFFGGFGAALSIGNSLKQIPDWAWILILVIMLFWMFRRGRK